MSMAPAMAKTWCFEMAKLTLQRFERRHERGPPYKDHTTQYAQHLAQHGRSLAGVAPGPVVNFAVVAGFSLIDSSIPQLDLNWDPPTSGDPPTAYKVFVNGVLVETTTATSTYVTALTVGQQYSLSVKAINPNGGSTPVVLSAVAQVQPSAPLHVQAVPGDGTIDVYWVRICSIHTFSILVLQCVASADP